ncbi:unnamed protein product [Lymnaea stagnalis]|uniref:Fucosyltransferase n=1 Tax=Lymnaea stagnalis TaxID=6523 RepID=A0AAV2HKC5_LYMST
MAIRLRFKIGLIFVVYVLNIQLFVYMGRRWNPSLEAKSRAVTVRENQVLGTRIRKIERGNVTFTLSKRANTSSTLNSAALTPRVLKFMDLNPRPNGPFIFNFDGCEFSRCAMTSRPEEVDVMMINGAKMKDVTLPPRPAGQIWLLYSKEPVNDGRFLHLKNANFYKKVNWTRTYRKGSTFWSPYGILVEKSKPPAKDYGTIYQRKKYDVAWFVGHCQTRSNREAYVGRMMPHVDIHIYGACGNRSCGSRGYAMGGLKDACLGLLSKSYKFYLSFENSLCSEYVTEKFFNMFDDIDVVPVVRGGADYDGLFPKGTFINSKHFDSPESLAKHLHRLSRDKEAYISLLSKKNRYKATFPNVSLACQLCKAAHTRSPSQVYDDIYAWLTAPGNCHDPNDL